jgi:hypothetical protein
MIWSATITEIAIVISACRRSCLVPAQQQLLHDESDDGDAAHRDDQRRDPFPAVHVGARDGESLAGHRLLDLVCDVAAEQVKGAVGHVHHAHEPEDQREAAGDDEQQAGERDRVEEDPQEGPGILDRRAEGGRSPIAAADLGWLPGDDDDVENREQHRGRDDSRRNAPDDSRRSKVRSSGGRQQDLSLRELSPAS